MTPAPPAAISFDAAGTLIELTEPVGVSYTRVAAAHGVRCEAETLQAAFGRVWKRTAPPFSPDAHEADPDERSWWRRLVREVFHEAGAAFPDDEHFDLFFASLYDHFESPGTWRLVAGAGPVLARVAETHRCVVLSNFDSRLRRILADLGVAGHFEAVFLSCEHRLSKPDPRIFAKVTDSLGLPPGEILHVGDDPECDWRGAREAGFRLFKTGRGGAPLPQLLEELFLAHD